MCGYCRSVRSRLLPVHTVSSACQLRSLQGVQKGKTTARFPEPVSAVSTTQAVPDTPLAMCSVSHVSNTTSNFRAPRNSREAGRTRLSLKGRLSAASVGRRRTHLAATPVQFLPPCVCVCVSVCLCVHVCVCARACACVCAHAHTDLVLGAAGILSHKAARLRKAPPSYAQTGLEVDLAVVRQVEVCKGRTISGLPAMQPISPSCSALPRTLRDPSVRGKPVGFEIGPALAHSIWEIIMTHLISRSLFVFVHKFGR